MALIGPTSRPWLRLMGGMGLRAPADPCRLREIIRGRAGCSLSAPPGCGRLKNTWMSSATYIDPCMDVMDRGLRLKPAGGLRLGYSRVRLVSARAPIYVRKCIAVCVPRPAQPPRRETFSLCLSKMARPLPFNTTHRYDTAIPDATISLAQVPGGQQSLSIFNARGARQKFRVVRMIRRDGEPKDPHGDALYLDVDRNPVIPMYTLVQFQPNSWDINVRYDEGGEPEIYPFRTKADALEFQVLVTGYSTAASFEGLHISVLHVPNIYMPGSSILKRFASLAELEAMGEVQLWQRRDPPSRATPAGPRSVASDSRRGSTSRADAPAGDAVSLQTDPVTRQGVYILDSLPPPALVIFIRGRTGEVTMLKVDHEFHNPAQTPPFERATEANPFFSLPHAGSSIRGVTQAL